MNDDYNDYYDNDNSSNTEFSFIDAIENEDYVAAKEIIGSKLSSISLSRIEGMRKDIAQKIYSSEE